MALRRLHSPSVTAFLHDRETAIRREAVRAIHDDLSIPEVLPMLASLLDETDLPADEGVVRRALNANLRLGTDFSARRLMRFATDARRQEAMRVEAVECLGVWNFTPYIDRVEGMVRALGERPSGLGDQLIKENLAKLLGGAGQALAQAITRIVMENHIEADPALFADWVMSTNQPPSLRAQALELLAHRGSDKLPRTLRYALEAGQPELRRWR